MILLVAGGNAGCGCQDAPIIRLTLKVPGQHLQGLFGLFQPIQSLGMDDQGAGPRVAFHHLAGNFQGRLDLAGIEIDPAQKNPILRIIGVPGPGLPGQFQGASLVASRRGLLGRPV